MNEFMCERDDAMTEQELQRLESFLAEGEPGYFVVRALADEIRALWDDKLSMVPVEQS
jgi:hypothetical protein